MHELDIISTLAGGFAAALVLGYVCHLIRLSPIVGFLVAGIVIGPTTPGFTADPQIAAQLAEIGVVLLLFDVGLHFDLHELGRVRKFAVPGALLQCLGSSLATFLLMLWFSYSWQEALVMGIAMSFASTVVVTRLLSDANELQTPTGNLAIGWLIVQDVLAVLALVMLPNLKGIQDASWLNLIGIFEIAALKIAVLVLAVFFLGSKFIPKILHRIAQTRSRELFTLTILVIVLGLALISSKGFGVSMALGAFLAGVVIGQSDFSVRATTDALPMRDAFAALFFVSVGMLFDPIVFFDTPGLFFAILAIAMVVTPAIAIGLMLLLGLELKTALRVGLAFAQIGEFSFIVASLAKRSDLIPESLEHVLVAVSIFSIALCPLLQIAIDPIVQFARRSPRLRWLSVLREPLSTSPAVSMDGNQSSEPISEFRTVVIGYGPVGRTAAKLLSENGIAATIIEMNPSSIEPIRAAGHRVVLGDASHVETLKAAGVESAVSLILSASNINQATSVIQMAKLLNPSIQILVRSAYIGQGQALLKQGADQVIAEESEVALAMAETILRNLGATAEQIDHQRDKLRADLS
ncbi:MAG: cation:proton antiporter [Planctomycetaceae bacterium]|jgi:CPA2 family monovalent cation:H+ antiporter-2|nr:cation:proton antiporter [Planctomycetaceae bacterium]